MSTDEFDYPEYDPELIDYPLDPDDLCDLCGQPRDTPLRIFAGPPGATEPTHDAALCSACFNAYQKDPTAVRAYFLGQGLVI